ncbi:MULTISPECIES: LysR family transcriptional regulator [Cetobacterium]|uniref:HTH lysR-type domain-containing protein n=2 Tax=Cetobacterium TaxID=180162 RepID=U7V9N0_9FUSO|nr:LysR family transcriptional regulator [Cetobacterium somerae]ERT68186.1 hypothetical protein HMPREF0202_01896 [Cetobacterium somerae ATCC BAA-474]MCQ9628377.1 LysR family transcriptional regulator [Cetobacterium somerae]
MDIKQLKYFLAITEENSITKAAKKLHISQPPLSHQLKILEEEIGSKLFDRTTRNLEITEVGEFLKNRAIQILELINETVKEIKQNQEELEGILKIGFVASSTAALVPKVIPEFSKNNPEVKFELKEGSTYKILDLLNHGTIEIGFIRTPFNSEEFDCIYLSKEPMIGLVDKNKYFQEVNEIDISFLEGLPLIIDKRFKKIIVNACYRKGFIPNILLIGEDSRTLMNLAQQGMGIAIVPESSKNLIFRENSKVVKIKDEELETQVVVAWLRNKKLSSVAKHFLKFLK